MCGMPNSNIFEVCEYHVYKTYENIMFLGFFGVSLCLQRKIILVLGVRDTSENPEIIEMRVLRVLI